MSNVIDRQVVAMEFDNRDFEKNTAKTMSTLDKLKSKLNFSNSTESLNALSAATESVTQKFSVMNSIAFSAVQRYTNMALSKIESIAKSVSIDQITAGWSKFEEKTTSVKTIMNATGDSLEKVNTQMERLMWFTDETSYSFTDMASNIGKFTANGIELESAVTAMEGIATWAAMSGQNAQAASRAMYNLSQAIGMGALKLMDWKSIELANMGTKAFKEVAIQTGKELGTLIELNGKLVTSTKKTVVTVKNFRDTLNEGWLSSEVLMSTLKKYGDFSSKLEETVRTLSMVSTKGQVTATEFLDVLSDYSDKIKYAQMYTEGFAKKEESLREIQEATGQSLEEIQNQIGKWSDKTALAKEAADELGVSAKELLPILEELSSQEWALGRDAFIAAQEARTLTDAINATKDAVSSAWMEIFESIVGKEEDATEFFSELTERLWEIFAAGPKAASAIAQVWSEQEQGGRNDFVKALWNVWDAIDNIANNIREAWQEVFPKKTAEQWVGILQSLTLRFKAWSESIKKNTETLQFLRTIVVIVANSLKFIKGVMSQVGEILYKIGYYILAPIAMVAINVGDAIARLITILTGSKTPAEAFSKIFNALGKAVEFVGKGVELACNGIFIGFSWIRDILGKLYPQVQGFFNRVKALVSDFISGIDLSNFTTAIGEMWSKIAKIFSGIFTGATTAKDAVHTAATAVTSFSQSVKAAVKPIQNVETGTVSLFDKIKTVWSKITDFFSKINWSKVLGIGSIILFIATIKKGISIVYNLVTAVTSLATNLNGVLMGAQSVLASVTNMFNTISKTIKNRFKSANFVRYAKGILIMAAGIAILAGAVALLTQLDQNALSTASLYIVGIIGALAALAFAVNGMAKTSTQMLSAAALIISMSASIGILVHVIKEINGISVKSLIKGGEAIAAMLAGITLFAVLLSRLSKGDDGLKQVSLMLISLSAGVLIMVKAMKKLTGMSTKSVIKGVLGLLGIAAAISLIVSRFKKINGKQFLRLSGGIILFSAGLALIMAEMKFINKHFDYEEISSAKWAILGIGGIFVVLAKLSQTSKDKQSQIGKLGLMMLSFSASILLLLGAITILNLFDPHDLIMPIAVIGILGTMFALIGKLATGANSSIKTMIGLAAGIGALALSLAILSLIDAKRLIGAAEGLSIAMVAFAAMIFAARGVENTSFKPIIAMVAGIVALSIALGLLSEIDSATLLKTAESLGLVITTFALAIAAASLYNKDHNKSTASIISLTICAGLIGGLMYALSYYGNPDEYISIAKALGLFIMAMTGSLAVLSKFQVKDNKSLIKSLLSISLAVVILGGVLTLVSNFADVDCIMASAISIGTLLGVVTLVAAAMAAVGLIPGGESAISAGGKMLIKALGYMALVILAIAAFSGILSILDEWAGGRISETVLNGIELLGDIISAIVNMFGKIGVSFVDTVLQVIDILGEHLAAFAENIQPFIDALSEMKPSVAKGAALLAEAILAIFSTSVLDAIFAFFTGESSFAKFSRDVPLLGEAIKKFVESISELTDTDLHRADLASQIISKLAAAEKELKNHGGWLQDIIGDSSLGSFATDLGSLAPILKDTADKFAEFDDNTVAAFVRASDMIKALAKAEKKLKNHGGWLQKVIGDSSLGSFATDLAELAPILLSASEKFTEFNDDTVKRFQNASDMIGALAAVENELKNHNGWVQDIIGDSSLGSFATDLATLAPILKDATDKFFEIDDSAVGKTETVSKIISSLASVEKELKNHGGWVQKLVGDSSLSSFVTDMSTMMPLFKTFVETLDIVPVPDQKKVDATTACIKAFSDVANALPSDDGILDAIVGGLFGDQQSLSEFLAEITSALPALSAFILASYDLPDAEKAVPSIEASAKCIGALSEITKQLPTGWSIFDVFTGEHLTIGEFLKDLVAEDDQNTSVGEMLKSYCESVSKLTPKDTKYILQSAECIGALADIAQKLPKGWSIFDVFEGEDQTIGQFLSGLLSTYENKTAGEYLVKYAEQVSGLDDTSVKNIKLSAEAIKALADVASAIADGEFANNAIIEFVHGLWHQGTSVAQYVAAFARDAVDVTEDSVKSITLVGDALKTIIDSAKGMGEIDSSNLVDLASDLVSFGSNYKSLADEVTGVDNAATLSAIQTFADMIGIINSTSIDQNRMAVFADSMKNMATNGVNTFVEAFSQAVNGDDIDNATGELVNTTKANLFNKINEFKNTGIGLVKQFVTGINETVQLAIEAAKALGDKTVKALNGSLEVKSPSRKTMKTGMYTVMGLRNGILQNIKMVTKAATEVGDETMDAMNDSLGVHSPSIFAIFSGKNLLQGLINGIKDKFPSLISVTEDSGSGVLDTIRSFFNKDTGEEITEGFADGLGDGFGDALDNAISSGASLSGKSKEEIVAYATQAGLYTKMALEKATAEAITKKYSADILAAVGMETGQKVIDSIKTVGSVWQKYVDDVRSGNEAAGVSYADGEAAFVKYVDTIREKLKEVTKDYEKFDKTQTKSVSDMISGMKSQAKAMTTWGEAIKSLKLRGVGDDILDAFLNEGLNSYSTVIALADADDRSLKKWLKSHKNLENVTEQTSADSVYAMITSEGLTSAYKKQTPKIIKELNKFSKKVIEDPESFLSVTKKSFSKVITAGTKDAIEGFSVSLNKAESASVRKYIRSLYEMSDAYAEDEKAVKSANKTYNKLLKTYNKMVATGKLLQEMDYTDPAEATKKTAELLKEYGVQDVNEFWKKLEETKQELMDAGDDVAEAQDNVSQHILETYTQLRDTIASSVKSLVDPLKESFKSVIGVFDEFNDDDKDISIDKLISNMESQVTGYEMWRKNLETIRQNGASEEFMEYLESLGVGGAATVKAFAAATSEQIQNASWMFANQQKAGWESITDQMIFGATQGAKKSKEWSDNLLALGELFSEDFVKAVREKGVDYADVVEALLHASPETVQRLQSLFDISKVLPGEIADKQILGDAGYNRYYETGKEAGEAVDEGVKDGVEENSDEPAEAVDEMGNGMADSMDAAASEDSALSKASKNVADNTLTVVTGVINKKSGKKIAKTFVSGLEAGFKKSDGNNIVKPLIDNLNPAIKSFEFKMTRKFEIVGSYIAKGLATGIMSAQDAIMLAVGNVCIAAIEAGRAMLAINSPSKVFEEMGAYTGEGFIIGLAKYDSAAGQVASKLGEEAISGITSSIAGMSLNPEDDFVIRPIVDMTDVNEKALMIQDLFGDDRSTRLGMSISADVAKLQNEKYSEPVITKADIQQMIDSSAEKYGAAIIEALDGVTFESNLVGEVNSRTLFDTVRQENHVFKRTHGYNGL